MINTSKINWNWIEGKLNLLWSALISLPSFCLFGLLFGILFTIEYLLKFFGFGKQAEKLSEEININNLIK